MDFKEIYDKALQKTYTDGLKYDQSMFPRDTDMFEKVEAENEYRHFGLLFGINLYNNIERILKKETKKNKKKGN